MSTAKKDKKRERPRPEPAVAPAKPGRGDGAMTGGQRILIAAAAALVVAIWAYAPAMNAAFLFDDTQLPFAAPTFASQSLMDSIHGQRPLLMASYWLSAKLSPQGTWWFHFMNVLIHFGAAALVFFIVRRLLEWSRREPAGVESAAATVWAGIAASIFLLHPVQTEAVAYLAGRSESLSVMFAYAAFAVFLYRPEGTASWRTAALVLLLFGAALLSKEQTIALPALLLLTDYWWNPGFSFGGIRGNWRIYAPILAAGAAGAWLLRGLILGAKSAGFGIKEFTWYQYLFTECRALIVYIRLFLFPVHQSADWGFPISRTITDQGAIVCLLALVALAATAWHWRRQFPLASYGYFAFLILMAPTSSVMPISDALAERRLYFGILGLLLIVVDLAGRIRIPVKTLVAAAGATALLLAVDSHARAEVWSSSADLWKDTVQKSSEFWRPHFHLGMVYFQNQQYDLAIDEFQKTDTLNPPAEHRPEVYVDWGLAYFYKNQARDALTKLYLAAKLTPTAHILSQIGMVHGSLGDWQEALQALNVAERLDPRFSDTYVYRGTVYLKMNQTLNAVQEYQKAVSIDPTNENAQKYLQIAQQQLNGGK